MPGKGTSCLDQEDYESNRTQDQMAPSTVALVDLL